MRTVVVATLVLSMLVGTSDGRKRRGRVVTRAIPVLTRDGRPNIQAQSAIVVDLDSGEELFAKNPDEVRPIASISKLVAMIVVLDRKLDLDAATQMIESDRQIAQGGARSRLPVGMSFTNRDLLHAALMASDNRAVPALGRAVGLDPQQFVAAMNQRAKELGMKNTHFEDPVGLNAENKSTTRDLVVLLRHAIKNPLLTEITQKPTYTAHPVGKPGWAIDYMNTDVLTRNHQYQVLTGKTGYTDLALYCLAVAVKLQNEHNVAMVFLGAVGKMTRFADVTRATQWLANRKSAAASSPPAVPSKG